MASFIKIEALKYCSTNLPNNLLKTKALSSFICLSLLKQEINPIFSSIKTTAILN